MSRVEVEGRIYKVTDSFGYVHDIGMYAKEVMTDSGPKKIVKLSGSGTSWRFWTAQDRVNPLVEWMEKRRAANKLIEK